MRRVAASSRVLVLVVLFALLSSFAPPVIAQDPTPQPITPTPSPLGGEALDETLEIIEFISI